MQLTAVLAEQTFIFCYLSIFILSGVNSKCERYLSEALGSAVTSHLQLGKRLVLKNRHKTSKYVLPITSGQERQCDVQQGQGKETGWT